MHKRRFDDEHFPDLDSLEHNSSAPPANEDGGDNRRPPVEPDGPVPFLMLRGHWLHQMGFYMGARVAVQAAANGVIVLRVFDVPGALSHNVPTRFGRDIHYTEVEPHTHIKPSTRGRR